MKSTTLTSILAVAISCVPLFAQQGPRLIGLTKNSPAVLVTDTSTCKQSACQPQSFPASTGPFRGGSAYDATTRGLWISDGLMIAKVDPRDRCRYQCKPAPMPNTSAGNAVTGLAFSAKTQILFVTDSSGVIRWYQSKGCSLVLIGRCQVPLPANYVLSGCAVDDLTGSLFYCASDPNGAGGIIYVAPQSSPCNPTCKYQLDRCTMIPLSPLTGLAYDSCNKVLHSVGRTFVSVSYDAATCSFSNARCCVNSWPDSLVGLSWLPSTEASTGRSCASGGCAACTSMSHVLAGDPTVGNPMFRLDLQNAPANANAFVVLNFGVCSLPGLSVPMLCGPVLVPLAPLPLVGFGPLATGGVGCTGSASLNMAVPSDPSLCGLKLSSQYVGLCAGGSFVSNCLTWSISSS